MCRGYSFKCTNVYSKTVQYKLSINKNVYSYTTRGKKLPACKAKYLKKQITKLEQL